MRVERCSYLIDAEVYGGDKLSGTHYTLSHLEFVTLAGLESLIDELGSPDGPNEMYFPRKDIEWRLNQKGR
jgi:hypothetical protein